METIGKGRGLKVVLKEDASGKGSDQWQMGVVTGHHSFAHEQSQLVENESIKM